MCKYLLLIVMLLAVSGCYTTKKANRQVYKAHEKHEIVVARACASFYPTRATETIRDTQFVQGEPITTRDTVVNVIDGVKHHTVYQKTFIHDTLKLFTTLKIIDSARMRTMQIERDSSFSQSVRDKDALIKAQNRLATSQKQKWISWSVLILLALGFVGYKFFRPRFL